MYIYNKVGVVNEIFGRRVSAKTSGRRYDGDSILNLCKSVSVALNNKDFRTYVNTNKERECPN